MPRFGSRVEIQRFALNTLPFIVVALAATSVWALGEGLGETKEQLKLQYDISSTERTRYATTFAGLRFILVWRIATLAEKAPNGARF